jgi:hypothetical protein
MGSCVFDCSRVVRDGSGERSRTDAPRHPSGGEKRLELLAIEGELCADGEDDHGHEPTDRGEH